MTTAHGSTPRITCQDSITSNLKILSFQCHFTKDNFTTIAISLFLSKESDM